MDYMDKELAQFSNTSSTNLGQCKWYWAFFLSKVGMRVTKHTWKYGLRAPLKETSTLFCMFCVKQYKSCVHNLIFNVLGTLTL